MTGTFKALEAAEENGRFITRVVDKTFSELPGGEVLIKVRYSSLNYKDALSASGNKGVTRHFPHTPGIDAAGIVAESSSNDWQPGDAVIVTGFDLGMNTSGGFAQYIRVPAKWVVRLPAGLTLRESMCYGTAGFTAGLSVAALVRHGIRPADGSVVVTGATGGVGSMAVAILSKLGYQVHAVSSKSDALDFLHALGATEIIPRSEMDDRSGKALLKPQFAAAVDTVGGNVLATVLKSLQYGGIATACGMVNGGELPVTVFPFILKGIHLAGIDSAEIAMEKRLPVWQALAGDWKPGRLESMVTEISLEQLPESMSRILNGEMSGRGLVVLPE